VKTIYKIILEIIKC